MTNADVCQPHVIEAHQEISWLLLFRRQTGPMTFDEELTAEEQMFFFDAPLAHVIAWREHCNVLLRRRAGRMTFVSPQKRRALVFCD